MNCPPESSMPLAGALRLAAADLQGQQPPPDLQARVRAAAARAGLAAVPTKARRGLRWPWGWPGAATFATVLVGSAVLMLRLPAKPPVVDDGLRFGGFMPVAPPDRWPHGAAPAWLVRTELQGDRLAALGLPYDPARAGESVRAELLLHPSGDVLAVRILQ